MNATETPRKGGKTDVPQQTPAIVDTTLRHVPPMVCPKCGRGMTPLVERWRPANADGVQTADCKCTLNNCMFVYTPASVRLK